MKGSNWWTEVAGQEECVPSGKKTGQKVVDLHNGKTMTPLTLEDDLTFFQEEISFPIGGQTNKHSLSQATEKASVAVEPGKA